MSNFVKLAHKYCFSYMPKEFFGFVSSDNLNEKMHDLIKAKIPIEKRYV